jgi:hypothetical protein
MASNESTRQTTRKKSTLGSAQRTATHRRAAQGVRETETVAVDVPIVGHVNLPRPEELAYYVGLTVLAVAEIIDWPVALVLAAGHALNYSRHSRVANELGDVLDEIHAARELGEALDESGVAEEIGEALASPPG